MTETANRPSDVITGPAQEAQVSAGATSHDTVPNADLTPVNKMTFDELLQALGHGGGVDLHREQVAICWKRPGGTFTPELQDPDDAARYVGMLTDSITGGRVDMWFGINPVSSDVAKGRGTVKDVTRLAALYADLDVKPGACPDLDTARLLIDDMSDVLGMRPVAVIHSGHGLQPIWAVERGSAASLKYPHDAKHLLQRFRHAVEFVAACHGCAVDPVFDLPRILRVPDTTNWKDVEHPVPTWCEADTGNALTIEQITEALDEFGAPESQPRFGTGSNGQASQRFSRRALINRVAKAPEGQRNRTLYGAARDAARQGDLDTDMVEKLADAAVAAGLDHGEIDTTIYSAACAEGVDVAASASPHQLPDAPIVDGAALLTELRDTLCRYVRFPDEDAAVAVALWVAATHAIEAWNAAPRLVLNSPQKRCGKTRALDVITGTCHAPLATVNASAPAIFRSLGEERPPTLVIDEADAIFGSKRAADQNEDLRSLLNAGYQRNRPALRCVAPQWTPTEFPTFAMVALAGIGTMPDTITDRAINITMRRRTTGEPVSQFRSRRDEPVLHAVRDRLAAWALANIDVLTDAVPEMPVEDRAADTWEPLISVADAAGGRWPEIARKACVALVEGAQDADETRSLDIRLLTDIRRIFTEKKVSFLSSAELVGALVNTPDSPWKDFNYTTNKLAHHLDPFGVKPGHNTERTKRGYRLESFHDAFERYTRPEASESSPAPVDVLERQDTSTSMDAPERPDGSTRPTDTRCSQAFPDAPDAIGHPVVGMTPRVEKALEKARASRNSLPQPS